MKRQLFTRIFAAILCAALLCPSVFAVNSIQSFSDQRNKDLSEFDFRNQYDLLCTLDYNQYTKWPSSDKLPTGFSPQKLLEWGKNPGLGLRALHTMGYTGKGVNVAYADQPLVTWNLSCLNHEVANVDLHYNLNIMDKYKAPRDTSMHGPAVLSILAGLETGVAPDASVYFVANPAWLADQRSHADCIREIISINKSLPIDQKIKVIGFSDNVDGSENYPEEFNKAIQEAKKAGLYVLLCREFNRAVCTPFSDRDNPDNYYAVDWNNKKISYENNQLYISTDRTVASKQTEDYRTSMGGLSWTTPYAVGLMAIGWQINPELSAEELLHIMCDTATGSPVRGGLINPVGFVQAVEKTMEGKKDYALLVYNSAEMTKSDLSAIQHYALTRPKKEDACFVDVKGCSTAAKVYEKLKGVQAGRAGKLTGIQIFGTAAAVPAFPITFKVQMLNGLDSGGHFLSDYFYGNFSNETSLISNYNICDHFSKGWKINLVPDWPVVRLPLASGDYTEYFTKCQDYCVKREQMSSWKLVNFSNPIFSSSRHIDDMSWFIKHRMDEEFHILSSGQYALYGNSEGLYPVTTKGLSGVVSSTNLAEVNKSGMCDFMINGHGQKTNLDQSVFVKSDNISKYQNRARQIINASEGVKEVRISLVNVQNLNTILGSNYYNLILWSCNSASDLDTTNLAYAALGPGKALNAFAATSIISNNGVNNSASAAELQNNNFFEFYYSFLKYYYGGMSRADSFFLAKRDYVNSILNHSNKITGDGNYQFNLHNVLTYEHLGLLWLNEPALGSGVTISRAGKIVNGNTFVPMRALLEALGYNIMWDRATKTVTASNAATGKTLVFTIGLKTAVVSGQRQLLTSAPQLIGGVTYIPLRFACEASGCRVTWEEKTHTAAVEMPTANRHTLRYRVQLG